ncbi:unannotated protein [freshwater metagenome]|uniref:Unannotated protein n=1 Tax=freshwater metagenome TaxID=449393 RepID=A0A6J7C8J6_9ZZZZ
MSGINGRGGHPWELRGARGLGDREPAGRPHGANAVRTVGAGAGEDHGDGAVAPDIREGTEQDIGARCGAGLA